jgi:hypothetical protein
MLLSTISRAAKLGKNMHFKLLFDEINMFEHTSILVKGVDPELVMS